jgi:hypothetical protein
VIDAVINPVTHQAHFKRILLGADGPAAHGAFTPTARQGGCLEPLSNSFILDWLVSIFCSADGAETDARSTPELSRCRSQRPQEKTISSRRQGPAHRSTSNNGRRATLNPSSVCCRPTASACGCYVKRAPECFEVRGRLHHTRRNLQPQERTLERLQETLGEGNEMRLERMESQRIQAEFDTESRFP